MMNCDITRLVFSGDRLWLERLDYYNEKAKVQFLNYGISISYMKIEIHIYPPQKWFLANNY